MINVFAQLMIFLVIGSQSTIILAADDSSGWHHIVQIHTLKDDGVLFKLTPSTAHPNPAGCSVTSWMRAGIEQSNLEEMHQMALVAQDAGKMVNATVDASECSGNYAKLISLSAEE